MRNIATANQEFVVHRDPYTIISNVAINDWAIRGNPFCLLTKMLSLPENWDFSSHGLYVIMNTNPITKKFEKCSGWSERSVRNYITTLKNAGYVKVQQLQNEDGTFGRTIYHVFSTPQVEELDKDIISSEPQSKSEPWSEDSETQKVTSSEPLADSCQRSDTGETQKVTSSEPLADSCQRSDTGETQKVTSSEPLAKSCHLNKYNNNKLNKQTSRHTNPPKENSNSGVCEKPFVKPTFDEVKAYAAEKRLMVDPFWFYEYYENEGWKHRKGRFAGKYVNNWKNTMLSWHKTELKSLGNQNGAVITQASNALSTEEQNQLTALKKTIGMFDPETEAEDYNYLKKQIEELEGRYA